MNKTLNDEVEPFDFSIPDFPEPTCQCPKCRSARKSGSDAIMEETESRSDSEPEVPLDDGELYGWENLILFRPSRADSLWLEKTIPWGRFQLLDDGEGHLYTDLYRVTIQRLPKLNSKRGTEEELLSYIRRNINEFIDTNNTTFSPFEGASDSQRLRWLSEPPSRAVLHLEIFLGDVNIQDATVMLTKFTPTSWRFSTVFSRDNLNHPVSGNREFGIGRRSQDEPWTLYTMGADRVCCAKEWFANFTSKEIFEGQDRLWRSFQEKVADFVNSHEGEAEIRKPINKKFFWHQVVEWRDSFCPFPERESNYQQGRYSCGPPSIAGRPYRIKSSDNLLAVTSKAYGVSAGNTRLTLARYINSHSYNHRFWRKPGNAFEHKYFANGIISFNARFACSVFEQMHGPTQSPPGRCYASIFIPTDPRT